MLFIIHLLVSAGLAWSLGAAHLGGGLLAFALLYLLARLLGLALGRLRRYARSLEHGVSFCLWFIAQIFLATYHVAILVLARRVDVEPAVLAYPVTRREVDKVTLLGTGLLLLGGTAAVLAYEWGNPATLGPPDPAGKLLGAAFHSAMTRSGGFNALDMGVMRPETWAVSYVLMMIGGGSAGIAGGIKVTTFLVLGFVVWAEIRGEPDVTAFGRRISRDVQRQALTVALLAVAFVGTATLVLLSVSDLSLDVALFETVSAFATVGLSTGVTAGLGPAGQTLLVVLMFLGRVGTITVATGLALRGKQRPYRYPEERPIVG